MIGTMVADRYRIEALISTGGMGRVYRAVQETLDRLVAVKIIDPRTLSVKNAADMTARFMTEARAASRLNHPNVVSVFDFGRTSSAEHAPLFLAMALLAGPSLADVLESAVVPLPLPRVVSILRQTLAALGEAHHVGITHRDVKPANIILQRRRDQDHVSVIDFGVARIGSERKVTGRGELLGTPQYMAPELILSDAAGPSVDLYAVGVILYEMLTGRVPFNGETALKVCYMQTSAPRPDPRSVAPRVPDALAEVCLRAIAVDPTARFPDAQALAEAIANAASIPITVAQASVFPPRISSKVPPLRGASARPPSHAPGPAPKKTSKSVAPPPPPPSEREATPLVGRDEALAWGRERLADPRIRSVVYWGKTGTGRSRMLGELSAHATRSGAEIVRCEVERGPHNEVGYSLLRALVSRLAGHDVNDSHLVGGHAADDRSASTGLREVFGTPGTTLATEPGEVRANVVASIAWAAQKGARAAGRPVIVVIDDVDKIDGVSRACLWDFVTGEGVPNVVVLAASELEPPVTAPGVAARELLGLSREEAAQILSPAANGERPSIVVEPKEAKASKR
jgi:serine/threonine-protein kinase